MGVESGGFAGAGRFRLIAFDHGETMLQSLVMEQWRDLYSIIPCGVRPQDVIPANHYSSTHPDSFFTKYPMAALNTAEGKVTLRGRLFRSYGRNGIEERELADIAEFLQVMTDHFGVGDLDQAALSTRLAHLFVETAAG